MVNYTPSQLKKLSTAQLVDLLNIAKNGLHICGECEQQCRRNTRECDAVMHSQFQKYGATRHRIYEDSTTIQAISAELYRRQNVRNTLIQNGYLFPTVPQGEPK